MINLTSTQYVIAKISYHTLGLIGYLILRKTRPEFYKNRSDLYMFMVFAVYVYFLGPVIFIFSLLTLIVDMFRKQKPQKPEPTFIDDLYCNDEPDFYCSLGDNGGSGTRWCKKQCAPCADGYGRESCRRDKPIICERIIIPGSVIMDMISEKRISFSTFAYNMGMTEEHAILLINSKIEITSNMARSLSITLGSSEEFWTNLETNYRKHKIGI